MDQEHIRESFIELMDFIGVTTERAPCGRYYEQRANDLWNAYKAGYETGYDAHKLPEALLALPDRWRSGGYSADTRASEAAEECADELEVVLSLYTISHPNNETQT